MTLSKYAIFCAAMGACATVSAGSVMELVTTEYRDDPPVVGTIEISAQDGVSRMEVTSISEDESGGMIFRENSGEFIVIDHEEKEYYLIDDATLERIGTQLSSAMQQMQQALADMPPEQRAMAEQMMQQHLPAPAEKEEPMTVQETGKSDTINGFDCVYYEVQQQGVRIRELCVTDWDDIDGGREASTSMIAMAGFFDKMAEHFSASSGMDMMGEQRELFQHMKDLGGYAVLTREFDGEGRVESESRLKSARSASLDPALFDPPRGYARKDLGI
jgi:hypothetical protein